MSVSLKGHTCRKNHTIKVILAQHPMTTYFIYAYLYQSYETQSNLCNININCIIYIYPVIKMSN